MIWKYNSWIFIIVGVVFYVFSFNSCKYDLVLGDDLIMLVDIIDIFNLIDFIDNLVDILGMFCDLEVVYFELDVLFILCLNCVFGGCYDDNSVQDGVILIFYILVINIVDVEAFDLDGSDLYEVIIDDDFDKCMLFLFNNLLMSQQINLISKWILQGVKSEICNFGVGGCDMIMVSFVEQVLLVINMNCFGCYNDDVLNVGIFLSSYEKIKVVVE